MANNTVASIFALLLLAGCTTKQVVHVKHIAPFRPPLPDAVHVIDFDWKVWTPELMKEYLTDVETNNAVVEAYYSLTPKNYEILSNNMAELKRYIREQSNLINYYRQSLDAYVDEAEVKPSE